MCTVRYTARSARVLLSMWVHAYFFSAICNEHWVLNSFGDTCLSVYPCSCDYTLTIPPPHTLPYYPRTKHHSCPLSQFKTIGGGLPPLVHGRKTYDWRAAAPTLFVFVLIATCIMACQDLEPGFASSQHPCMQPHFTPTSCPPTPLHPVAISVLAINSLSQARRWASSQQPLRIERPSTSPHALAKYTKEPWLYPPLPLTKERSFVGRA